MAKQKEMEPEELKKKQDEFNSSMNVLVGPAKEEMPDTTEQALAKGVHKLTHHEADTIKLMSELPTKKRAACANCLIQAEVFHNPMLRDFIYEYLRVGVSVERRGRKEIVHVVSTVKQEQMKQGMLARIRGFVSGQPA